MVMVDQSFSWKEERKTTSNREDAVRLTRLQSGYTLLLKAYAQLLGPAADPMCQLRMEEPQTQEHRDARDAEMSGP